MRHPNRRSRSRTAAFRMDPSALIEPGIAFLLAMFVSWAIAGL